MWIHVRIRRKGRIQADSEGKIGINLREKTEENGKKRREQEKTDQLRKKTEENGKK